MYNDKYYLSSCTILHLLIIVEKTLKVIIIECVNFRNTSSDLKNNILKFY